MITIVSVKRNGDEDSIILLQSNNIFGSHIGYEIGYNAKDYENCLQDRKINISTHLKLFPAYAEI